MPLYHVHRYVDELNKKPFKDQAEIVYVNASYQDDSPLGRLMHDMNCKNPEDMYYPELAERANYFKTNEHGVSQMCEAMEKLIVERENKVRRETEENIVLRMINNGKSIRDIADAINWPVEQINAFLHSRNLQSAQ